MSGNLKIFEMTGNAFLGIGVICTAYGMVASGADRYVVLGLLIVGFAVYWRSNVKALKAEIEALSVMGDEFASALSEGRDLRSATLRYTARLGLLKGELPQDDIRDPVEVVTLSYADAITAEGRQYTASKETVSLLQPSAQNRAVELSTGGVAENGDMELCTGGVNSVFLIGEVVTEPEVRYLVESGEPIFSYRLATEGLWNDFSGKFSDENEYHQIKQIGEILEYESPILSKGDQVYINGFMRTREEVDSNGMKQFTTYIYTYYVIRLMKKEEPQLCRFFE